MDLWKMFNVALFYICFILAIISLIKADINNAKQLLILSLIFSNSADLKELESKINKIKER